MNKTQLDKLFDFQKKEIEKIFSRAISNLQNTLTSLVSGFPEINNGVIPNTEANLQYMANIYNEMLKLGKAQGYTDAIDYALQQEGEIVKTIRKELATAGFPAKFTTVTQETFNLFQRQKYDYLANLSTRAITAIKEATLNAVIGSSDLGSLINTIQTEVGDKLQRYAYTYLETSRGQLIQATQEWTVQELKEQGIDIYWEYVGPLDNDTREECDLALQKRVFTDEEKADFQNGVGEIPHNEPRWNCRHAFVPISENRYKELAD